METRWQHDCKLCENTETYVEIIETLWKADDVPWRGATTITITIISALVHKRGREKQFSYIITVCAQDWEKGDRRTSCGNHQQFPFRWLLKKVK